jgi:hypothetical protein
MEGITEEYRISFLKKSLPVILKDFNNQLMKNSTFSANPESGAIQSDIAKKHEMIAEIQ